MLTLNYDSKFDIVYISISDASASLGEEPISGLVVLRDFTTEDITGITIFDFCKKYKNNTLPSMPIEINLEKIYNEISNPSLLV